jgi:hypothetical protein
MNKLKGTCSRAQLLLPRAAHLRIASALAALAAVAGTAQAADIWWGGGTGDFATAANWGGVMPGSSDNADINNNGQPYPTLSSGNYTVFNLLDGYWAPGGMTMNGGTLGVGNLFSVGYNGSGANATFTLNNGTIGGQGGTDPQQLWVGYQSYAYGGGNGTLTMNAGRVDVEWTMNVGGGANNTVGTVNLNGGQINLWQQLNVAANGSQIDISGSGDFSIWNLYGSFATPASLQAMINSGLIIGNGVVGDVVITPFSNGQGGTGYALTAVPEPAAFTLVLLGFGGLSLARRRRQSGPR